MLNKRLNEKRKGFSLIELMITVAVIGILSGLFFRIINVTEIRKRTRDSQRVADLKRVQTALELYFTDNRRYPQIISYTLLSNSSISGVLEPNYISKLPADPMAYSSVFSSCSSDFGYSYRADANGTKYVIVARTESTNGDYVRCSTLSNCADAVFNCNDCTTNERCHAVQNPL